ncbi:preprotein translocase subunit SecE [Lactobacillus crispatus]|uniref:Preprotein translocase subunit SecE n=1 Tax=Lactobacillus crispatus TaxID=47770 RepID=A0AB37DIQ7_9LACO|nr:preprotein translocase subunit SecE [Lactobacillus crispatus]QHQ69097.1 hypothetical protein GSR61_10955 [Lactobacillus crispatus]
MNYLIKVSKVLKKVTWEKIGVTLKHTGYMALVVLATALCYWGIDQLVNSVFTKL